MSACATQCATGQGAGVLALNQSCDCLSLARAQIDRDLLAQQPIAGLAALLGERPHLFASTGIFVSQADHRTMLDQISAIETVTALPKYREFIRARDPALFPSRDDVLSGLLMSYDFHLTDAGPKLIEVNTNAGGAFVVQALIGALRSQISPCDSQLTDSPEVVTRRLVDLFVREWQRSGRRGQPNRIAIVDDAPSEQYLYPDMLLAQSALQTAGIPTDIVPSQALRARNGELRHGDERVDMVYNRLTDFRLQAPESAALKAAIRDDLALVSPTPAHHALHADKRNLSLLSDQAFLLRVEAPAAVRQTLAELPRAVSVDPNSAAALWSQRKSLFFKPSGGYGGKATYRGSKLTQRVWKQIANGGYVAQRYIAPGSRTVDNRGEKTLMKYDVRIFTYSGQPIVGAARIYQGQATNFRSPGGGFAPLIYLP